MLTCEKKDIFCSIWKSFIRYVLFSFLKTARFVILIYNPNAIEKWWKP